MDWTIISTIYSDELYPWDAGKAPWSAEKGGTGEGGRLGLAGGMGAGGSDSKDSKAGILPANIVSYAGQFSDIKIKDTEDVRLACDLVEDIVKKVSEVQKDPKNPHLVEIVTSATYTNLAALKLLGHPDDQLDGPDQEELWEAEQARQKVKQENHERSSGSSRHGSDRHHGEQRRSSDRCDDHRGSSGDHRGSHDDHRGGSSGYRGGSSGYRSGSRDYERGSSDYDRRSPADSDHSRSGSKRK